MAKAIDLGRRLNDILVGPADPEGFNRPHYPDLYISDVDEPRLLDMPDKGTATIKYRITGREHSERDRHGEKERRCSIRMEIISIEPPAKKNNGNGAYGDDARKSFSDYFKGR